ncbi:MAG: sigma 54-interacting transcriptional regulator [Planctomycetia bacterium]|nr:sigma 54-interacting transcriptional regulator [Planctomycetia bacterium]
MSRSVDEILGASNWAEETRHRVAQIARHRYSVVITGPPGSGKRFVADMLHGLSPRADRPFIPVDCSLLSENTFASQLFGHEPGAFAAAQGGTLGCFRAADGGTLFLGRVELLPLEFQPLLLDALKTRRITPLGGSKAVAIDVRLICSSLSDLQKEIQRRHLLPELYPQLDSVSLTIPPLADRAEDIELLARSFLATVAAEYGELPRRLGADAMRRLLSYSWPGNVAELRSALERAALMAERDLLTAADFSFLGEEENR